VDDDPYLFIGATAGGVEDVYVLGPSYGSNWAQTSTGATAIYDLACSPNFNEEADPLLLALVDDAGDCEIWYKYGGGAWNGAEGPAVIGTFTVENRDPGIGYGADIGFPDDFDGDPDEGYMEFFVALDDAADLLGGAWWIIVDNVIEQSMDDADCVSIDIVGDVGDGYIMVGTDDGDVHYSDDFGDGWDDTNQAPSGDGDVFVLLFDTEEALAAASDAAVTGAGTALSFTSDGGDLFSQISLINMDKGDVISYSLTPDGSTRFVVYDTGAGALDALFKYASDWERVFYEDDGNADLPDDITHVQMSREYPADEAVFIFDAVNDQIWRSTDGGGRFKEQNSNTPVTVGAWVIIDDTTLVIADAAATGDTYKTENNGTTWDDAEGTNGDRIVSMSISPDFDDDDTLLCANDGGEVFISDDAADGWDLLDGGADDFNNDCKVTFHRDYADNGFIYCATNDDVGDVLIARYDPDDDWETVFDPGDDHDGATGIACSADGTLYVTFEDTAGMYRSVNPDASATNVVFELVDDDYTDAESNSCRLTTGSNVVWTHDGANIWMYEDTMTGAPSLKEPANKSSSERVDSVTLIWSEMDGADEYEIRMNTRDDFDGAEVDVDNVEVTSTRVTGLEDGRTYYWKVRVAEGEPVLSRWSDVFSFTTAHGAAEWNPFIGGVPESPANGATNVPLMPTFSWNAADWATGYEFVLADNANFTSPMVNKTGANALDGTVYAHDAELAYDTTYYWKVRAVSATSSSEWATGIFSTGSAPPPPPPAPSPAPTVTQPPQVLPSPIPDALLWAIIGIGGLLGIAVIVLIVRTRRPS
jgi:hypothetical protein